MTGGSLGGGLGGTLGSILGVALAPETGGLSLALPAGLGALGGFAGNALGDAVTGERFDPGAAALSGAAGGVGGGIGGALSGPSAALGGGTAAAAADPFGAGPAFLGGEASLGADAAAGTGSALGSSAPAIAPVADPGISGLPIEGQIANELGPSGGALSSGGTGVAGPGGGVGAAVDPVAAPASAPTASVAGGVDPNDPLAAFRALAAPQSAGAASPNVSSTLSSAGVADPTGGLFGSNGPLSGVKEFLKSNRDLIGPAGLALSLGKSALFPSKIPGQDTLAGNAGIAQNIATQNSGGLNPSQSAASQQSLDKQISDIKAKYASLGLAGSTAEQQDINNARNSNLASQAQAVDNNAKTALAALGVSNAPTQAIAQQQLSDDKELSEAIALMAAAGLSGKA